MRDTDKARPGATPWSASEVDAQGDHTQLEILVALAAEGDREALGEVLRSIQDQVYRLSLRMLGRPEEAQDATQEILVRVMTRLSTFRGECRFTTWVYRVACNMLLRTRQRLVEREFFDFDQQMPLLVQPPNAINPIYTEAAEARLLINEAFLSCTQAMLLCLDRPHRLALILGDLLELSGPEAAAALDIPAATYRKRLSRARARLGEFMGEHCGVVNPEATCRCSHQINTAVSLGWLDPQRLCFARHPGVDPKDPTALESLQHLGEAITAVAALRRHPAYRSPDDLGAMVRDLIQDGPLSALH